MRRYDPVDAPFPMNRTISLLVPTRGRPALVQRLFRSLAETTARRDRVEIVLYVDEDDLQSHGLGSDQLTVQRIIGPRQTMGSYNTACLKQSGGDIVILGNDDMVVRTIAWDEKIAAMDEAIADGIYLAYANDLFMSRRRATFPILSRRCCDVLGDPFPAAYRGAFIDTHLFDLFKRVQRAGFDRIRYLDDVVFEHLHYRTGKAEYDETYRKRGRFDDDFTFIGMAGMRSRDAKRLLQAIRGDAVEAAPPAPSDEYVPGGFISAIGYFARTFLIDTELPLRWRGFLFYTHIGRYLAGRGLLGPLVRVGGAKG